MTSDGKVSVILISLLASISAYFWQYRANSSGFHYSRVADLTYQLPDEEVLIGFQSFYWDGLFLAITSTIIGLSPVDSIYLPYILIVAIPSVYLATKCFTGHRLAILIGFGIIFFVFSRYFHHSEYRIAMALYPAFVWALYRYIMSDDIRMGVTTAGLALAVFLLGLPMAAWGVGTLLVVTLGAWILRNQSDYRTSHHLVFAPIGLTAFLTIVYLWFNRKIWEQLPEWLFALKIGDIFGSSGAGSAYAATSSSPEFLTWINITWFLLATVPVIIGFLWIILKRGFHPFNRDTDELYLLSVLIGCAGEIFVYLLIRGINLRSVRLLSPIAAGYYIYKYTPEKIVLAFGIVFLSVSLAFTGATVAFDMDRPAAGPQTSQSAGEFVHISNSQITTDHNSIGEIRIGFALNHQNPRDIDWVRYNEDIAKMVFDGDPPPSEMGELFIVNTEAINYPLATGSEWSRFQAINNSYDTVENHGDLSKVYSDGTFDIYDVNNA